MGFAVENAHYTECGTEKTDYTEHGILDFTEENTDYTEWTIGFHCGSHCHVRYWNPPWKLLIIQNIVAFKEFLRKSIFGNFQMFVVLTKEFDLHHLVPSVLQIFFRVPGKCKIPT